MIVVIILLMEMRYSTMQNGIHAHANSKILYSTLAQCQLVLKEHTLVVAGPIYITLEH